MEESLLKIILNSGPIAQVVLATLTMMSLAVWAWLYLGWQTLSQSRRKHQAFLELYTNDGITGLSNKDRDSLKDNPQGQLVLSAADQLNEFLNESQSELVVRWDYHAIRDDFFNIVDRNQEQIILAEEKRLSHRQSWLATVSVVAPFIGLFGTVLGIVDAFHDIAQADSVDLSVVAPGISEALLATAFGLFAAIPATLGYNLFRSQIQNLISDLDSFALRLTNDLHLQFMKLYATPSKGSPSDG